MPTAQEMAISLAKRMRNCGGGTGAKDPEVVCSVCGRYLAVPHVDPRKRLCTGCWFSHLEELFLSVPRTVITATTEEVPVTTSEKSRFTAQTNVLPSLSTPDGGLDTIKVKTE